MTGAPQSGKSQSGTSQSGASSTTLPTPLVSNTQRFVGVLRSAGLRVGIERHLDFLRALTWIDLADRQAFFHSARALLVSRQEDLRLFRAIFDRFWCAPSTGKSRRPQKAPRAPRHDASQVPPFTVVTYMAYKARQHDPAIDVADRSATYSDQEALQRKDFSHMTPEELTNLRRWLASLEWRACQRRTRRRRPTVRGEEVDRRRSLRLAGRFGGVPLLLPRQDRQIKDRPVVLLADISGSMEKLSRLVLQFFYGMAHSLRDVESFAFGTRLTRLTPHLRLRNIDRALDQAGGAVADWSGGTRIGACLGTFNRRWSRRVLRRGAVVLLVSDGWEQGDSKRLRRETAWLQNRCHRLIWLNPLAAREGYRPSVEGMAAALPFVDDFLPIHNLQSLFQLADHLRRLPARRGGVAARAPRAQLFPDSRSIESYKPKEASR